MSQIVSRSLWLVLTLFWAVPTAAWALDPDKFISQYAHAAWRSQDGLFTGSPVAVVQTRDGYVWLGTSAGLLRFDGIRFTPWISERGERLPSSQVRDLLGSTDGSLWIATDGGLSRLQNGTLTHYSAKTGRLLEDHSGTIWLAESVAVPGSGSLCRVVEREVRCLGDGDAGPRLFGAGPMIEDAAGALWIGDGTTLHRWSDDSQSTYETPLLSKRAGEGIMGLASTPDGTVWLGFASAGTGLGLQHLVQGHWRAFKTPDFDGATLAVTALRVDRAGSLWVGTVDKGLYRLRGNTVDHFDSTNGLSSDLVLSFEEDREGSLWVTTSQGVDRFSDTAVISFSRREGLCSPEAVSILAARDGGVWIGGHGGLTRLRAGRASCIRTGRGLPGTQVTALLEDRAGRLWIGIDDNLWIYHQERFRKVTRPNGSDIGFVTSIAEDTGNDVWVVVRGPRRTVMRIHELAVKEELHDPEMPRRVAAAATGGVWVGTVTGDLAHQHDGKLAIYRFPHDDAALLNQLLPGADGSILAATSFGLIGWHNGKQLHLTSKNGLPCDAVNAIAVDAAGNLWLFMDCALGLMTSTDLQMWKTNPDMRISLRTFGVFDGVRTGWAAFDAGATSADGRVWFANSSLLQMVDPAHLARNTVAPPVHVARIIADRKNYPAAAIVRLPPLTRDLEIDYVGLSFIAPQKVLFRYRLEGRDDGWQEPGTRRQAFYNDLRPGAYRFRVTASNNDGVWNEEGATLEIVIAPSWYQTRSFLIVCIVSGIAGLYAVYHLRLRQVARQLNARFDERLAERTRMARDLHDTLLQTVQGTKMVADDVLRRPEDAAGLRRAMEQVSSWLGQASAEGRAAVSALRASTTETNDLAGAFRRAIEDCARSGSLQGSLTITGDPREMHPVIRDEVYRIGYEAIRNACVHSRGSRLEVALTYARDLTIRIVDDGVGIEAPVAGEGREGHFGLQGMRERARRVGARLTVTSSAGAGTDVTLAVPGRIVFRR